MLLNLKKWFQSTKEDPLLQLRNSARIKRSPKMSKLYKKQKLEKKKRKKKKQQKLTPRQIKHYRRIREHKEKRRRILHKKLKEKRRLRHKKMGTGPYNKSIIDYYGVYFDSSSSQLNDSLYDSIYDTDAIDTEEIYQEHLKNYPEYSGEKENEEDEEDEEYTVEESSDEEDNNSTMINYEDPPSAPLNDSLFNSIYDTEAIDSDKIYEEQMKNYPESEEVEESEESEEEENSEHKGSSDISKGDDDKKINKKLKESKESKNIDNKNNKLKNRKGTLNGLQMKSTNKRKILKSKGIRKSLLKASGKMEKSHSVQVADQVNKQKSAPKLLGVKQTENKILKTKINNEHSHFKNKVPLTYKRVEQKGQSKTKYHSKSHLVDIIFDNKPEHDNSNLRLDYQDNTNYLISLKQDPYIPNRHYGDILPIIMRDYASVHRRMPI